MPNFKICKVYPRNGIQTISGILPKQERIELPAKVKLNEKEIRRCMSFATVYEVVEKGDVLLTPVNYLADNSKAEVAKDVPGDELKDYTVEQSEEAVEPAPSIPKENTDDASQATPAPENKDTTSQGSEPSAESVEDDDTEAVG